jgi:hypothetical protein
VKITSIFEPIKGGGNLPVFRRLCLNNLGTFSFLLDTGNFGDWEEEFLFFTEKHVQGV